MTTYTWPTAQAFRPAQVRWRLLVNERRTTSALSGYTQVSAVPGARWALSLDMPEQSYEDRRQLAAFIDRLNGGEHLIAMWDPALPAAQGTVNLTGVAVAVPAAQFASVLILNGCGSNRTILGGTWLGVGGLRLRVVTDATSDFSGMASVQIRPALRVAVASGSAVTFDKPTSTMMLAMSAAETPAIPWGPNGRCPGFTLELVERWA